MRVEIIFANCSRNFKLEDLCLVPCNGIYYFCHIVNQSTSNFAMGMSYANTVNGFQNTTANIPLGLVMSNLFADEDSEFHLVIDDSLVNKDGNASLLHISTILPIDEFDYSNGYVSFDIRDVINNLNKFNEEISRGSR